MSKAGCPQDQANFAQRLAICLVVGHAESQLDRELSPLEGDMLGSWV